MSFGEPEPKRLRRSTTEEEENEIIIIKNSILNSIDYIIPYIAKEIAEFSHGKDIDCDNCEDDDAIRQCENCGWNYCRLCVNELCEAGKHCYHCTKKELIIKCWQCQMDDGEPFTPTLCLECDKDGKYKENIYFCNTCKKYECDSCFHWGGKTSSFWECADEGCYQAICGDCYKSKSDRGENEWSFCECDENWCGKHKGLCCNCFLTC